MIVLVGKLPLNVLVVYRTVFSSLEEAKGFSEKRLGAYTFLQPMGVQEAINMVKEHNDNTLLIPVSLPKEEEPCKND